MTKTRTSALATSYRSVCALLIGAMSLNCTAADDGFEPTIEGLEESEAGEIDETLIAIIDAPVEDPERSYYELRSIENLDGAFELRGFSEEGYVSRMKIQQFFDLDQDPWIQLELEDENLSMAGHFRLVNDDGTPKLEIDADVNGRVVALRLDPSAPQDAEIYGFPGAPEGVFSSLMAYDDTTGLAAAFMTSWQRVGSLGPEIERELNAADGFKFRSAVTCAGCWWDLLGATFVSGGCIAAAVGASAVCGAPTPAVGACPAAVAVAMGACGVAAQEWSNFFNACKGACADAPRARDRSPAQARHRPPARAQWRPRFRSVPGPAAPSSPAPSASARR